MMITMILKKRLSMSVILFILFGGVSDVDLSPESSPWFHVHCSLCVNESAWVSHCLCVHVRVNVFYTLKRNRYAVILAVWICAWTCRLLRMFCLYLMYMFLPFPSLVFFLLWVELFLFLLFCPPCLFPPYGDRLAFRCNYLWNQKIVDK